MVNHTATPHYPLPRGHGLPQPDARATLGIRYELVFHPGPALGGAKYVLPDSSGRAALPGWVPGQQGPHEGPLVTEYAAALVPDAVRLDEVRVAAEQGTVLLVGGETGEAEQRQGLIAGSLGRQEVAVVHAAM